MRRHYRPGCLVLETEFETPTGCAVIVDFMRLGEGGELVRIVMGRTGSVTFRTELVARFNYGASVRAAQFIVLSAKARALAHHRFHVAYEDITALAIPVLRHRILLNFHAESDRIDSDEILRRLLEHMPPPSKA